MAGVESHRRKGLSSGQQLGQRHLHRRLSQGQQEERRLGDRGPHLQDKTPRLQIQMLRFEDAWFGHIGKSASALAGGFALWRNLLLLNAAN